MSLSRLASSSSASEAGKSRRAPIKRAEGDSVDTSRMSNMMARNAKDVASLNTIRKEKIEAFKHIVDSKPSFSDAIVDKILNRLVAS